MSREVVVLFTAKSTDQIIAEGGTSAWRLDRNRARLCEFAVCSRNAHAGWGTPNKAGWIEGTEPHHTAFLIGKIRDVVPCEPTSDNAKSSEQRYLIQFSEYATVDIPNVWRGDRNPVKYMSLDELRIDPSTLDWKIMMRPITAKKPVGDTVPVDKLVVTPLTMAEAKKGLALTFNVPPEAIEITIRG